MTNIAANATYKWQRFDDTGANLETNSIGTGSTYTLTHTDAGKKLKVVVNFTDDASNSEGPLTSAPTSPSPRQRQTATPHLRWRGDADRAGQEGNDCAGQ